MDLLDDIVDLDQKEYEPPPPLPSLLNTHGSIVLPRKVLLTMSLEEFDTFVQEFPKKLSATDTRHVRRQRRLISNRESAAASRNRQRQMIEDLKRENEALKRENKRLKLK